MGELPDIEADIRSLEPRIMAQPIQLSGLGRIEQFHPCSAGSLKWGFRRTLIPKGSQTAFRDDPGPSEHSDADFSIVLESVRLRQVKPVGSAAEEGCR